MERPDYRIKAKEIHQANIDAGWWKRRMTTEIERKQFAGDPALLDLALPRNIGELLCLVHSEIDEAYHGHVYSLFDDHIPQYLMAQVELADTAIRAYDILGYYDSKLRFTELPDPFEFPAEMAPRFPVQCLVLHGLTTEAMEGFRKGNEPLGVMKLWHLLDCLYHIAEHRNFDLDTVMDKKLEYNRNRADHKIENRMKEGGKQF